MEMAFCLTFHRQNLSFVIYKLKPLRPGNFFIHKPVSSPFIKEPFQLFSFHFIFQDALRFLCQPSERYCALPRFAALRMRVGSKCARCPFNFSPSSLFSSFLKKIGNKFLADVCDKRVSNRDTLHAITLFPAFNLDV